MNISSSARIILAILGIVLITVAAIFGMQFVEMLSGSISDTSAISPAQAPVVVLSLFGFATMLLSLLFPDESWQRGAQAGSLSLLLMLYPTFRAYTGSLEHATGFTFDNLSLVLLIAGFVVLLWAALAKPRPGSGGFLCGFIAGLIPVSGLSVAWVGIAGVHGIYLGLLSLPYPRLADCMTALMDSFTFTIVVMACFMFVPVLLGLLSFLRSRLGVAGASAVRFPEKGWPAVLFDMSLVAYLSMTVLRPAISMSLDSWMRTAETIGYVPRFAPAQAILFFSIAPFLVLSGIIWAAFVATPGWRSGENKLNAMMTGVNILIAGLLPLILYNTLMAYEILLILMGSTILLLARSGDSGQGGTMQGASADGIATRLTIAGNVVAVLMTPLIASALIVGIGYVTLISYCTLGDGSLSFAELRKMSGIEGVWALTASFHVVVCFAMIALYALNTAWKSLYARMFSSDKVAQ